MEIPGLAHQDPHSLLVHLALTFFFPADQAQMELFSRQNLAAKVSSEYLSAGYNNQIKIVVISHV